MDDNDKPGESSEEDDLPDTDPVTPADTPSALLKLGLAVCPVCEGMGSRVVEKFSPDGDHEARHKEFVKCDLCDGAKRVTIEAAAEHLKR